MASIGELRGAFSVYYGESDDEQHVGSIVQVQAERLFEAAAYAVATFREHGWAADALTSDRFSASRSTPPTVVHEEPLRAVERWLGSPSGSPKEAAVKINAASERGRVARRSDTPDWAV